MIKGELIINHLHVKERTFNEKLLHLRPSIFVARFLAFAYLKIMCRTLLFIPFGIQIKYLFNLFHCVNVNFNPSLVVGYDRKLPNSWKITEASREYKDQIKTLEYLKFVKKS